MNITWYERKASIWQVDKEPEYNQKEKPIQSKKQINKTSRTNDEEVKRKKEEQKHVGNLKAVCKEYIWFL